MVADTCTDQTAATARACGAQVISIRARNVGAARAAGMTELLRLTAGRDPAAIWLATTDADTVVPPGWLRRQLRYASRDWDVVLGTVAVTDWDGHPPHVPAAFDARYEFGEGPHPHVHGANLGIRASGLPGRGRIPAAAHRRGPRPARRRDRGGLLGPAGQRHYGADIGRRQARAPHGFGHLLRTLVPYPEVGDPASPGALAVALASQPAAGGASRASRAA